MVVKKLKIAAIVAAAGAAGIIGGYAGSQIGLEGRVGSLAKEACTKEQGRCEVSIYSGGKPVKAPASFSKLEKFEEKDTEASALDSKVGFRLEADETMEIPSGALLPLKYGQMYIFQIESTFCGDKYLACRNLHIFYYAMSATITSLISIYECTGDSFPDKMFMSSESAPGAMPSIKRTKNGALEFDGFNEEGARSAYDFYSNVYNDFMGRYNVEMQLKEYRKNLSIGPHINQEE